MMTGKIYVYVILVLAQIYIFPVNSQVKEENFILKYGTWALLQAIPSPTWFEDRNETNSRFKFGFEWQAIPFSYTFNTNKYLSKLNFLYIQPTKRFTGSAEIFFEPSLILGDLKYADLEKFMYKTGVRIVLPLAQSGEYLAISLGAGYYRQSTTASRIYDGITYEAAVYSFYGMLGLKFNYYQKGNSRYNFGIY